MRFIFCCTKGLHTQTLKLPFLNNYFYSIKTSIYLFIFLWFFIIFSCVSSTWLHTHQTQVLCSSGIPMRHPKWLIETFKTMTFWFQNALALLVFISLFLCYLIQFYFGINVNDDLSSMSNHETHKETRDMRYVKK